MDVHRNDPRLPIALDPRRLSSDGLQSLFSLNEQLLEQLTRAARVGNGTSPLVAALYGEFCLLDATTCRYLSHAPLLIDAGFSDPHRWLCPLRTKTSGRRRPLSGHWLGRSQAVALARETFFVGWYLVHTFPHAPKLLLGMCDPCVAFFNEATVNDVQKLSEQRYEWIKPRWETQPQIWRELIMLARHPPKSMPGSVALRAMALIAAEVRRRQSDSPRM